MEKIISLLMLLALTACSHIEYRTVPMQCFPIERPDLPVVNPPPSCDATPAAHDECLNDDTWARIERRDLLLRQYAARLENQCEVFKQLAEEAQNE